MITSVVGKTFDYLPDGIYNYLFIHHDDFIPAVVVVGSLLGCYAFAYDRIHRTKRTQRHTK